MLKQQRYVPLCQTKQTVVLEQFTLYIFMLIRPFELHTDSRDSRAYFIRKLEQQFIQFRYSTSHRQE